MNKVQITISESNRIDDGVYREIVKDENGKMIEVTVAFGKDLEEREFFETALQLLKVAKYY